MTTRDLLIAKLRQAAPQLAERWSHAYAALEWEWADGIPSAADVERLILQALDTLGRDDSRSYAGQRGILIQLFTDAGSASIEFHDEFVAKE